LRTTAPACIPIISIWKDGEPTFAGDGYAGVSDTALYAIGGILKHARALCAFTNPTTNSYKRLVPGFEAPVNLAYSSRNRSASVRIPMYSASPKAKRIEFRTPDPSCNGYLAFSAMLMAALDGIENKIDPGEPLDKDIYGMSPEELADVPSAPGSLEEALAALADDHAFLLKGDVFTQDVIDTWISYKTDNEVNDVKLRPHPHEFFCTTTSKHSRGLAVSHRRPTQASCWGSPFFRTRLPFFLHARSIPALQNSRNHPHRILYFITYFILVLPYCKTDRFLLTSLVTDRYNYRISVSGKPRRQIQRLGRRNDRLSDANPVARGNHPDCRAA
jgi:hypothetical protein